MGLLAEIGGFGKDLPDDADEHAKRLSSIGDFIQRVATADSRTSLTKLGTKLSEWSKRGYDFFKNSPLGKRLVRAAKTPIPAAGQKTIELMRLTTGFGDPVDGQQFGQGAARFGDAGATLDAAYPTDDWDSAGAHAYADQNTRQVMHTETVIGADQVVADVLTREAGQISTSRDKLDSEADWLADISLVTGVVSLIPYVGKAAATAAEVAAVAKAVGSSAIELTNLSSSVNANAAEIQQAAGRYAGVTNSSATAATADFGPPPRDPGHLDVPGRSGGESRSGQTAPPSWSVPPVAAGGSSRGSAPGGAGASAPAGQPPMPVPLPERPQTPPGPSPSSTPFAASARPVPGLGAPMGAAPGSGGGTPLGSLMGPLAGLLAGIGQRAGSAGPSDADSHTTEKTDEGAETPADEDDEDDNVKGGGADDAEVRDGAAPDAGTVEAGRLPAPAEMAGQPGPLGAARLGPGFSPGSPPVTAA